MKLCNEVITIYNKHIDTLTKLPVYTPTVISGVSWHIATQVSVTSDGLIGANQCTIRIPVDANFNGKTYTTPKAYSVAQDIATLCTIAQGDIIVKGNAVETGDNAKPAKLQAKYNDVITIVGCTDDTTRPNAKHWKVVGK